MIPLYARHKALMIRNGLEHDTDYLNRAFSDLADEDVAALILVADQRTNHLFRNKVANAFDMDLTPTFRIRSPMFTLAASIKPACGHDSAIRVSKIIAASRLSRKPPMINR